MTDIGISKRSLQLFPIFILVGLLVSPAAAPQKQQPPQEPKVSTEESLQNFRDLTDRYFKLDLDGIGWAQRPRLAPIEKATKTPELLQEIKKLAAALATTVAPSKLPPDARIDCEILQHLIAIAEHDVAERLALAKKVNSIVPISQQVEKLYDDPEKVSEERFWELAELAADVPAELYVARDELKSKDRFVLEQAQRRLGELKTFFGRLAEKAAPKYPKYSDAKEALNQAAESCGDYRDWLNKRYIPKLPEEKNPDAIGEERYGFLLKHRHLISQTPQQLLDFGWVKMKETKAEMDEIAKLVDPQKTLQQILEEMQTEHPTAELMVEFTQQQVEASREFLANCDFITLPDWCGTVTVRDVGAQGAKTFPFAGYSGAGEKDGKFIGSYVVATGGYDWMTDEQKSAHLRGMNNYWVKVTTVHEAYPGHHLQASYASRQKSRLRNAFGTPVFVEGWGLYSEDLMTRHGFFGEDPRYRLCMLQMRLWRCARVVIDVSLQTGKFSAKEAEDFLVQQVGMQRVHAEGEVRRYLQMPMQPFTYLVGYTQFKEMYEAVKKSQGTDFNEKAFHNAVLSMGSIPPALVKKRLLMDSSWPDLDADQAPVRP